MTDQREPRTVDEALDAALARTDDEEVAYLIGQARTALQRAAIEAEAATPEPALDGLRAVADFVDRVQEYARLTLRRDGQPGPLEVEANIIGAILHAAQGVSDE